MLTFDLHSHSTFSDGTLTPAQLIARAARRGVAVLALTDHDETAGLDAARTAAAAHGIRLIDGVEISVSWHGHTIHVVGLGIGVDNALLQDGLAATRNGRTERARKIAAAFETLGIANTFEGAQRHADNPRMIGRPHFARFLQQQGVVKDVKTAFRRFLGSGQPCCVPHIWATLEDAVAWIRDSGGVAVIAHPARYPLATAQLVALLGQFRDLGGAALEVISGCQTSHEGAVLAALARRFGLAASAGSDFHSPLENHCDLGGLPALPAGCPPLPDRLDIH